MGSTIEQKLLKYHKGYEEDRENLHYARKGIEGFVAEPQNYDGRGNEDSVSAIRRDMDWDREALPEESRTVAKRIRDTFIEEGEINLAGTSITSTADLADLLQIYRNPNFETFRKIYMRGDTILEVEGITCCLARLCKAYHEPSWKTAVENMKVKMDLLGADGYYLSHNHPSGKILPTMNDISITDMFVSNIQGFKGHIIIDHTECTVIDEQLCFTQVSISEEFQMSVFETNLGNAALLNTTIASPKALANVIKLLDSQDNEATSVLVLTDANNQIRLVTELSNTFIAQDAFKHYMRDQYLDGSFVNAYLGTTNLSWYFKTVELVKQGYLNDSVCRTDNGFVSATRNGIKPENDNLLFGADLKNVTSYIVKSNLVPSFNTKAEIRDYIAEVKRTEKEVLNKRKSR